MLDTDVLSELLLVRPDALVSAWFEAQPVSTLHASSITVAEIVYGLRIMPQGQRRESLRTRFELFLREAFPNRVMGFDEHAARAYGDILGARRDMGRPMNIPDGQIAAIAQVNGLVLATRNVRDFENIGLELINPFDSRNA
ncbi:MAG: type II toxin-antitoxin system VapC family toxin [Sphingomonadales bacterium]